MINDAIENLKNAIEKVDECTGVWTFTMAKEAAQQFDHSISTLRSRHTTNFDVVEFLLNEAELRGAKFRTSAILRAVSLFDSALSAPICKVEDDSVAYICWNDVDHVYEMPEVEAPKKEKKSLGLTKNQQLVLRAFITNDHVGDWGWDDPTSAAWTDILMDDCKVLGLEGKALSGTISKMLQEGLLRKNCPESLGLTDKGRAAAKRLIFATPILSRYM